LVQAAIVHPVEPEEKLAEVLTVHEVARYLRVHRSTVYRLIKSDQLPVFRVGSDWRMTRDALLHWVANQNHQTTSGTPPRTR
jgi:excisionase family DNA binding protein